MIKDYVLALKAALASGQKPETVFANLSRVLARRGHSQLLGRILRILERELGRGATHLEPTLVVAREKDTKSPLVAKLMKALGVEGTPRVIVDDSVIGGAKLSHNHTEIDATYKTALINLYQAITK
ncbi:MAG: F0F1 ATP synthase subunit delta [Candidatus Paceibacteria bacterium]